MGADELFYLFIFKICYLFTPERVGSSWMLMSCFSFIFFLNLLLIYPGACGVLMDADELFVFFIFLNLLLIYPGARGVFMDVDELRLLHVVVRERQANIKHHLHTHTQTHTHTSICISISMYTSISTSISTYTSSEKCTPRMTQDIYCCISMAYTVATH